MQQIDNRPSFKSLIYFSNSAFTKRPLQKLHKAGHYVGEPWRIKDSIISTNAYTDNICCCTTAIIQSPDKPKFFLAHLCPDHFYRFGEVNEYVKNTIATVFKDAASKLKTENGLTGIIIGANKYDKPGMNQAKYIKQLFDKLKIKYSAFIGQDESYATTKEPSGFRDILLHKSSIHANGLTDTYTVSVEASKAPKSLKDLKKLYKIVHIDKNDSVIFNN